MLYLSLYGVLQSHSLLSNLLLTTRCGISNFHFRAGVRSPSILLVSSTIAVNSVSMRFVTAAVILLSLALLIIEVAELGVVLQHSFVGTCVSASACIRARGQFGPFVLGFREPGTAPRKLRGPSSDTASLLDSAAVAIGRSAGSAGAEKASVSCRFQDDFQRFMERSLVSVTPHAPGILVRLYRWRP